MMWPRPSTNHPVPTSMNGFGLTVMGPRPQFTVALALTSALTSATAGTARSKAFWTETANEGKDVAARPALAASTVAHRTLEALAFIGPGPDMLALLAGWEPQAVFSLEKTRRLGEGLPEGEARHGDAHGELLLGLGADLAAEHLEEVGVAHVALGGVLEDRAQKMVGRDGIEPPTPGFSGLENARWECA